MDGGEVPGSPGHDGRLGELAERLAHPEIPVPDRVRVAGAGRKAAIEADDELAETLERLVDPVTRGDPQSPLRWTCKSTRKLAKQLEQQGHSVGYRTVAALLGEL